MAVRFRTGMRVRVNAAGVHKRIAIRGGATGAVVRLFASASAAWIELDERLAITDIHPFDDPQRANLVCAYPEDCEEEPMHKESSG